MLLELGSDQRLWRDTARDVLTKECPPSLVRAIAEDDSGDTGPLWKPLWKSYIDMGWTELTDPSETVDSGCWSKSWGERATPLLSPRRRRSSPRWQPRPPTRSWRVPPSTTASLQLAPATAGSSMTQHGMWSSAIAADRLAVATAAGVFVAAAEQVSSRPVQVFDPVLHVSEVTLDRLRVSNSDWVQADVAGARDVALTGLALTMVGACQRILDMVLEHVGSRQQFGVPIGSFQAVQHKAADMHIAVKRARALSYFAALTISADDPRRRVAAAMAKAAAGECQSLVFKHVIQLFGAMGFTWENDVQFALKRAKAGELMLGGQPSTAHSSPSRPSPVAARSKEDLVQLTFDAGVEAFRDEFAAFRDEYLPDPYVALERSGSTAYVPDWARQWQRLQFDHGWLLTGNPPEFGGRNATILQQFVHLEELSKRKIYQSFNPQGVGIIVASLL